MADPSNDDENNLNTTCAGLILFVIFLLITIFAVGIILFIAWHHKWDFLRNVINNPS
jgi:uncharacterized membrane protein